MDNRELFRLAKEAMPNAYAPFSRFKVGAALLTEEGKVFTGVNVENSSYGGTICAERTAAVKAIFGVAILSIAGSFARLIKRTVLSIAPVSLKESIK